MYRAIERADIGTVPAEVVLADVLLVLGQSGTALWVSRGGEWEQCFAALGCFCGESVRSSSLVALGGIEGSSCAEQCLMHAAWCKARLCSPDTQREERGAPCAAVMQFSDLPELRERRVICSSRRGLPRVGVCGLACLIAYCYSC